MELLLPLLLVDLLLGWMLWSSWRGGALWMGLEARRRHEHRTLYWTSLARLGGLLLLALIGTIAAWRAI